MTLSEVDCTSDWSTEAKEKDYVKLTWILDLGDQVVAGVGQLTLLRRSPTDGFAFLDLGDLNILILARIELWTEYSNSSENRTMDLDSNFFVIVWVSNIGAGNCR